MLHRILTPMVVAALAFVAVIAAGILYVQPAKADGWSGCYGGVSAGYNALVADDSSFGVNGPGVGVLAGCDIERGRFVLGPWVEYGWAWLDDNGSNIDSKGWGAGGRAGVLVTPQTLVFASLGWTQLDFGSDSADGLVFGGGGELDLGSNLFLRTEYRYTHLTSDDMDDASVQSGRMAVIYKFNWNPTDLVSGKPLK